MELEYFKLFANCVPVKGARRSVICDLQRHRYHFIPNDLVELLIKSKSVSVKELRNCHQGEDLKTFDEYFDFLIENQYGFNCSEEQMQYFPDLSLQFQSPSILTNAIIDVGDNSLHDFYGILTQLEDLGCKHIQIRFFRITDIEELDGIMMLLRESRIRTVQFLLQYTDALSRDVLNKFCWKHLRVVNIIVSTAPIQEKYLVGINGYTSIDFVTQSILDCSACGVVHEAYFVVEIEVFSEAQEYNSCLNRKIGIDVNGNIKNCPSMTETFGNIQNKQLKEVVKNPKFTNVWKVNKDQIVECMDCEFRYICTDCRAYLSDTNNPLSKPKKCSYNPYSATWDSPENER